MKNRSAIVTGASKGIGKAIAIHLARKGYNLLLIARSRKLLDEVQNDIGKIDKGLLVQIAPINVVDPEGVEKAVNLFSKSVKSIDILLNNAGYVKRGTSEIENSELMNMINVNLIGAINLIKFVLPIMKAQNSGYIINLSSRNAKIPRSFLGGYAASKAALLAFSESLYKELKNYGIKVTTLCPGFVDTQMTADIKEDRTKLINTSDISATIDFLLSLSPAVALKEISFESIVQIGGYC